MKNFAVVFEPGSRNWSAYVPDLPGCIATSATRDEVAREIRDAITSHIEGMRLAGEPIPEPTTEVGTVPVGDSDR